MNTARGELLKEFGKKILILVKTFYKNFSSMQNHTLITKIEIEFRAIIPADHNSSPGTPL